MDSSVSIFYVNDGYNWSDYLYKKLHSKEYGINCEQIEFDKRSSHSFHSSAINVLFVTPDFLEHQDWKWADSVDTNKCILVLTGTEQSDLEESVNHYEFDRVNDFFIYQLMETEESVRDLLIFIISVFEENDPQTHQLHHIGSEPRDFKYHERLSLKSNDRASNNTDIYVRNSSNSIRKTQSEDDGNYDRLPNLQRQVNGLRDVIYKDGKMYLLLWRRAEGILKVRLNNQDVSPIDTHCAVYELEYEGSKSAEVSVLQDGDMIGQQLVQIPTTTDTQNTNIHQSPARTVGVTIATQTDESDIKQGRAIISKSHEQSRESLYVNIDDVSREGTEHLQNMSRTNKLEYIHKILADETDPEEMLCQCLGIDKEIKHLDDKMTSMIQCVETLRHLSFTSTEVSHDNDSSTWPTLVHFGAQFNLTNFCEALLCNPLMYRACVTTNKDGNMPHDIARKYGHSELAEMLKHFSEFVKAEKERDSGISVPPGYPRLSTIIGDNPPPPAPHPRHYCESNYIDMSMGNQHVDYNEKEAGKLRQHSLKKPRENSRDGGFCGSMDLSSDDEYIPMSPKMSPLAAESSKKSSMRSSSSSSLTPSTRTICSYGSSEFDPERRTLLGTDEENDPNAEHHRKDVVNLLGMAEPPTSPDENKKAKKNSRLRKLFFGKKNRSLSEPNILPNESIAVKRITATKTYHRDSARSSSSTASTYSDTSMKEDDGTEVQLRDDKKNGKKIKGFLKKAKNRKSVRVKMAMEDNQIKVPALPSRYDPEVF